jgi:hypothetical protein
MHGIVWEADSLLGPTVLEEMAVSTPTGWSEQAEIAQVLFTRASSSAAATRSAPLDWSLLSGSFRLRNAPIDVI